MEIDKEIKNLIAEYIKKVEDKEEILTLFKNNIDKIISDSKKRLKQITSDLDIKFEANNISEEEYLNLFRKSKIEILNKTKEELNSLIQSLLKPKV